MAIRKEKKKSEKTNNNVRIKINDILDILVQETLKTSRLDSYYTDKADEMSSIDKNCFSIIAKRFKKADDKEKESLLQLLKHFKGVEHIRFLQEFIKKEPFWPRTGLAMLEVFNKSDAMLEEGLASRLLDLDQFAEKLKRWLLNTEFNEQTNNAGALVDEFCSKPATERKGILCQLIEETGGKITPLIIKIITCDEKKGCEATCIVSGFPATDSIPILEAVYKQTKKKEILKIIKKTAYSLNKKGVEVPSFESKPEKKSVYHTASIPEPSAVISSIDHEGYRVIFMVRPLTAYEYKVFSIMTNDVEGIHEIDVQNSFKKESQAFIDRLFTDKKAEFLRVSCDSAAFLVEEACKTSEKQNKPVSVNISQWKNLFSDSIGIRQQPLIYDHFTENEIASMDNAPVCPEDFFEQTNIVVWFISTQEAREQWMKMANILYTPIVLSDLQTKQRIEELQKETTRLFFSKERRGVFKRRLEDSAYFYYRNNEPEMAKTALFFAMTLSAPDMDPENNRFCLGMIKKGFDLFKASYKKKEPEHSSPPAEQEKQILLT